jgi:hypothetical protein
MSRFATGSALLFTFIAVVGATLIAAFFLFENEEQPALEVCRAASKTEYESAERDFLLLTSVGAYAKTGHWWRRRYWYCHL